MGIILAAGTLLVTGQYYALFENSTIIPAMGDWLWVALSAAGAWSTGMYIAGVVSDSFDRRRLASNVSDSSCETSLECAVALVIFLLIAVGFYLYEQRRIRKEFIRRHTALPAKRELL